MPSNPGSWTERKIFPMFSRCKMARTPGIFSAASVSSLTTRPLAIVASTGTAYSNPGKWKSEVYCAFPLTFNGPSTRSVLRPIGDVVGISCVADMFVPSMNHAVASWSACVRQRLANSILNAFSLCGLASRKAAAAAVRKFAWCTGWPTSAASADGDRARTLGALHMDRRFQCHHRHAHVRGVGGDAVCARAQDSEHAVGGGDRRAAGSGFSFVARHGGVAEVHAARALQEIAGRGRHVAELGRCTGENRLRQHGIISLHRLMMGEI